MNVATLSALHCVLGESPLWHPARKSFFWVDVHPGILYELNPLTQALNKWEIGKPVSLVLESEGDNVILAVKGGIIKLDLTNGEQAWLTNLDSDIPNNRCNDGAADSLGRLWIGTMDMQCKANAGSLYRLDPDLTIKKMIGGLTIPNGLVWSLDHERMYFIDTPERKVVSYLFNKKNGDIYYEKVAVQIPPEMGMPDGMAIDAQGMLWIALYGGGAITRWNPLNGNLLETVKLPALNITNCAFVGDDLDSMIVTSASENMSVVQLDEYPESGNVFIINNLPVAGVKISKPTL